MPIKCLGLSGVPEAGAEFRVCVNDRIARNLAQEAAQKSKAEQLAQPKKASLEALFDQMEEGEKLELNVIVKADTQGSVEAIAHALGEIKSDKVALKIILDDTGNITVNDVMLASASNAVVLGFHVAKEPGVDSAARREGVEIRLHHVIYELLDEVRDAMTGLLSPTINERVTGHAEIRQVFTVGKTGKAAGCMVVDGHIGARLRVRVKRGSETLFDGRVMTLRRYQDEVSEVRESQECGVRLEGFTQFAVGDVLEFYELEEVQQTL
jgi:translation initiation factor IF-2